MATDNLLTFELVTAGEAMRILGVVRSQFYSDMVQPYLPKPVMVGKRKCWHKSQIERVKLPKRGKK